MAKATALKQTPAAARPALEQHNAYISGKLHAFAQLWRATLLTKGVTKRFRLADALDDIVLFFAAGEQDRVYVAADGSHIELPRYLLRDIMHKAGF